VAEVGLEDIVLAYMEHGETPAVAQLVELGRAQ
jgi:hypothetical protein